MLPNDCWDLIHAHLTRDDVIAAKGLGFSARADCACRVPDAHVFARMVRGGMPICFSCAATVISAALDIRGPGRGLFFDSCNDPTASFLQLSVGIEDEDSCLSDWISTDLLTLTARKVLEDEGRWDCCDDCCDGAECCFCANSTVVERTTSSAGWCEQMKEYMRLATKRLAGMHEKNEERGYTDYSDSYQKCAPLICQRCGVFECKGDDTCPWFFGEASANASMAKETLCMFRNNKNKEVTARACLCGCGRDGRCVRCCAGLPCSYHFQRRKVLRYKPCFCKILM